MSDQFICAKCGKTFEKDWTNFEAISELEENFNPQDGEECDIFCDDCFKIIMNQ